MTLCSCGQLGGPFDAVYMEVRKAIISSCSFDACQAELVSVAVDATRRHDRAHICKKEEATANKPANTMTT